MLVECRYCTAPASRLYSLPPRVRPERRGGGAAWRRAERAEGGVSMLVKCLSSPAPPPRLYSLPPRVRPERRGAGPACYFCFIRVTGIKPTRRQLAGPVEREDAVVLQTS